MTAVKSMAKILMLITSFVAGCSGDSCYWYQPGKTFKQAKQDCRDCYCEALEDSLEAEPANEATRVCIYDRDPEHLPDFDDVIIRHDLHVENAVRGCMRRKGYRLTRAAELGPEVHTKRTCMSGECFPVAGR